MLNNLDLRTQKVLGGGGRLTLTLTASVHPPSHLGMPGCMPLSRYAPSNARSHRGARHGYVLLIHIDLAAAILNLEDHTPVLPRYQASSDLIGQAFDNPG